MHSKRIARWSRRALNSGLCSCPLSTLNFFTEPPFPTVFCYTQLFFQKLQTGHMIYLNFFESSSVSYLCCGWVVLDYVEHIRYVKHKVHKLNAAHQALCWCPRHIPLLEPIMSTAVTLIGCQCRKSCPVTYASQLRYTQPIASPDAKPLPYSK